ncbi:hypothetical protein J6590_077514 [Homalodisca vitripennis]|nr:hypothetical protein J6590_077514 [Homalodisca vitripennis]
MISCLAILRKDPCRLGEEPETRMRRESLDRNRARNLGRIIARLSKEPGVRSMRIQSYEKKKKSIGISLAYLNLEKIVARPNYNRKLGQ